VITSYKTNYIPKQAFNPLGKLDFSNKLGVELELLILIELELDISYLKAPFSVVSCFSFWNF